MQRVGDESQPPRKMHKPVSAKDEVLQRLVQYLNEMGDAYDIDAMNDDQMHDVIWNLDDEELTALIIHAVSQNDFDGLNRLRNSEDQGGFNYSLNVENEIGVTPLQMAAAANSEEMAMFLLRPEALAGCQLPMDAVSLEILHQDHPRYMNAASKMTYHPKKLSRQNSFIECRDTESDHVEKYEPDSQLGEGHYGQVRLFKSSHDPKKVLTVKKINDHGKPGTLGIFHQMQAAVVELEATCLQAAYPEFSPIRIKNFFDDEQNVMSSRIVMPFVPGMDVVNAVNALKKPEFLGHVLLAIAIELQRIHGCHIVHGDVQAGNILIHTVDADDDALPCFNVKFVDFGLSSFVGRNVLPFTTHAYYVAPERLHVNNPTPTAQFEQDIYSFGYLLVCARGLVLKTCPDFDVEFAELSQLMCRFVNAAISVNPVDRPKLADFITPLQAILSPAVKSNMRP